MRRPTGIPQYVCIPCLLRQSRRTISTAAIETTPSIQDGSMQNVPGFKSLQEASEISQKRISKRQKQPSNPHQLVIYRTFSALNSTTGSVRLSSEQQIELQKLRKIRNRLTGEIGALSEIQQLTVEAAINKLPLSSDNVVLAEQKRVAEHIAQLQGRRKLTDFIKDVDQVIGYEAHAKQTVEREDDIRILDKLGLLKVQKPLEAVTKPTEKQYSASQAQSLLKSKDTTHAGNESNPSPRSKNRRSRIRRALSRTSKDLRKERFPRRLKPRFVVSKASDNQQEEVVIKTDFDDEVAVFDEKDMLSISARDLWLKPLAIGEPDVPKLSFDLSRVLFNPGVYQLQDPRSRVFNFDPYLAHIMPVSEFNFEALNEYITSSEDDILRGVAKEYRKRYIGSSSSMSGALSHFHFLLSGWRELGLDNLSKSFSPDSKQVTRLHRGPTAIFLKYKDGVYAVDADKEYDSANILMSLGKSMEKLLTLEKEEFERYRKSNDPAKQEKLKDTHPEQYHYGEIGDFLMRSQLDAYDSRLPGTGMFDLKTRAVAAVRMNLRNHEMGMHYQIKHRLGNWESYEREYYDMMRSAFLKYSLQVRMGRMDGIFVAYHNVQRIFGFQYVALPELDVALHGQTDRTLGDQEFCISIKLLNEIFDRATAAFPEQNVRFHFETREKTGKRETVPYMYIFAEPISEQEAQRIQNSKKEEIAAFERRLFNAKPPETSEESNEADDTPTDQVADSAATEAVTDVGATNESTRAPRSNAANVEFIESLSNIKLDVQSSPVLGFKLIIRSRVNGRLVPRPQDLTIEDDWDVEYTLTQMPDLKTRTKYNQCKNRRAAVLDFSQDEDWTASAYIRNLMHMSQKGGEWRKQLDEADSLNETIVLYPEKCIGGGTGAS